MVGEIRQMIKIRTVDECLITCELLCDEYIPISINFENNSSKERYGRGPLFYWEIREPGDNGGMLEIGVGKKEGIIYDLTLVSFSCLKNKCAPVQFRSEHKGCPIIDFENVCKDKCDILCNVECINGYLSKNKIEITFTDKPEVLTKVKVNNNFEIGIDENREIKYFSINEITDEMMKILNYYITEIGM